MRVLTSKQTDRRTDATKYIISLASRSINIHVMDYDFRMMFRNHVQNMTAELILITDILLAVYEAERGNIKTKLSKRHLLSRVILTRSFRATTRCRRSLVEKRSYFKIGSRGKMPFMVG